MSGKVRTKIYFFFPSQLIRFYERTIIFSQIKKLLKAKKLNASEEKGWAPFVSFGLNSSWKIWGLHSHHPHESLQEKKDFLGATDLCPQAETGQRKGQVSIIPPCSLCSSAPQCICALAATRCKANDYLPCTDLYQLKNHCNLDLICLCNKWFVYTELDALPHLLEISLNHKTLVRPCLGKAETANLPPSPECINNPSMQPLHRVYWQKEVISVISHSWICLKLWLQVLFLVLI